MSGALLLPSLVQPLAWALLHSLWQGALVALALFGLLAALRRRPPTIRYALSLAALALLGALPSYTFWRLSTAAPETAVTARTAAVESVAAAATATPHLVAATTSIAWSERVAASWSRALRPLLPWLVASWFVGVALLSLLHLAGWLRLARLRRHAVAAVGIEIEQRFEDLKRRLAVSRPVRLLRSTAVAVPAVIGWWRPLVLVPAGVLIGMAPAELEAVLAHELAHIRRHDYLVNLFQALLEIVLFYQPAVWWVSRQVRVERELCCDDLAVAACGNRVGYARALARLEGLRPRAPRLAPAASGNERGTLLGRIRRLAAAPAQPAGLRRPFLAAGLCGVALLALAFAVPLLRAAALPWVGDVEFKSARDASAEEGIGSNLAPSSSGTRTPSPSAPAPTAAQSSSGQALSGTFRIRRLAAAGKVELELTHRHRNGRGHSSEGFDLPADALVDVGGGALELRREAGTFRLAGAAGGGAAEGGFVFEASQRFIQELASLGYTVDEEALFQAAALDLQVSFVRDIQALGYRGLPFNRLLEFRIHGVDADFIRRFAALGYRDLPADRLVEFRIHGVSPEFVDALTALGYRDVPADRLVELRIHQVTPDYIRALAAQGYREVPLDRLVEFRIHGVSSELLAELGRQGYPHESPDRVVEFAIHGVTPHYLEALAAAGYRGIDADRLVAFRIHGVNAEELREYAALGYPTITADELVAMRIHGVTPAFVRELAEAGLRGVPPHTLVNMRIHGVNAAFAQRHRGVSAEELIDLRIHAPRERGGAND
jgi:beta-lactamase regulating signal transducer with metallopeptidase domain